MLTPEQLTRLKAVCKGAISNAIWLSNHSDDVYADEAVEATAALADIDAEIELLKGAL